ncbi:MAG: glycoside hydrolase family 36 protein, partial [Candidatus Neomarinimicrobiota bacterium]
LAVGHLELVPKLISLPVAMPDRREATVAVSYNKPTTLPPGESLTTLRTFVMVHRGDHFQPLSEYRRFMIRQGVKFRRAPETAFEPIWCAWGYRRDFTMDQIYGTLPMVKQLGYKWAVLDDGWQTAEGDWYLVDTKFPNGDADMIKLVDRIHAEGLRAKLWWAPLAVDPGTNLIEKHPDYLLLNEDGSTQDISWWDSYYLCPAFPEVLDYTKELVIKMIKTWGYDGLKIDGQHLNGVPPCYNPAHNHAYPEESVEQLPDFFKLIYETALSIKPEAVVEICPCGTAYNFFMLPYMNQAVSSDPLSSWQIRLKGKTLRALSGNDVAYYGDHVELSDGGTDFASTVGIGGVIGTKFTWPVGAKADSEHDLTPVRVEEWDKWGRIYREKMLSQGTYRGELYDLGFDRPEAHAILKGNNMYYAFYASTWDGEVELRGLEGRSYRVYDYVNGQELGRIKGPSGRLKVAFEAYLLMEATPE